MTRLVLGFLFAVPCAGLAARADVRLGAPFADHMVLQREKPIAVWGIAASGETVRVTFAGKTAVATADARGDWRCTLPALPASKEPQTLTANGAAIGDVLVGEVWIAGGQSNMDLPIVKEDPRHCEEKGTLVAQYTRRPFIRLAKSPMHGQDEPCRRPDAGARRLVWRDLRWENVCAHRNASGRIVERGFSAIGYYFALELYGELDVPIGILLTSKSGTKIEPWIPREGYAAADGRLLSRAQKRAARGAVAFRPSWLWNGRVEPYAPMTARGVIWYQGCGNVGTWQEYAEYSHALYKGWAKRFENPELPFLFVQICPSGRPEVPGLQEAQSRFAAEEPHAAIVIANDVGNIHDVHPARKHVIAQRLAAQAFKRVYGRTEIESDSPVVSKWKIEGDRFVLTFAHAKQMYVYNEDRSLGAGFEIAGADGVWKSADIVNFADKVGQIGGPVVEVASKDVPEPRKLRFLHARPWKGVLYNQVSLPVGAFQIGK